MKPTSDQEAVALCLEGHPEVFGHLVRRYSAPIFRYAWRWVKDRGLAEDVVQETFLRAYRSLNKVQQDAAFSTWLFGIARHCCQEMSRRSQRPAGHAQEKFSNSGGDEEFSAKVEEALETLDEFSRNLIYMKHVTGMTCEEIASALGRPVGTVTGTLTRAYQKLREILGSQREES